MQHLTKNYRRRTAGCGAAQRRGGLPLRSRCAPAPAAAATHKAAVPAPRTLRAYQASQASVDPSNDVTLDFVAADITDVLKALAVQTGVNIVASPGREGHDHGLARPCHAGSGARHDHAALAACSTPGRTTRSSSAPRRASRSSPSPPATPARWTRKSSRCTTPPSRTPSSLIKTRVPNRADRPGHPGRRPFGGRDHRRDHFKRLGRTMSLRP